MSGSKQCNKFEVVIEPTGSTNFFTVEGLRKFLSVKGCQNMKRIKVLRDGEKAFITFADDKTYKKATETVSFMETGLNILPSDVSLNDIYNKQKEMQEQLFYGLQAIQRKENTMFNEIKCWFQQLEEEIPETITHRMLLLADHLNVNTDHLADEIYNDEYCDDEYYDDEYYYDEQEVQECPAWRQRRASF